MPGEYWFSGWPMKTSRPPMATALAKFWATSGPVTPRATSATRRRVRCNTTFSVSRGGLACRENAAECGAKQAGGYNRLMTDKTMNKLRSLLKSYAERTAKLQPAAKPADDEGEHRRQECGERLQQVVLPVLQAFVAELRSLGHGALIEDHSEG